DLPAPHDPHAAANEGEVHRRDCHRMPLDFADSRDHRVVASRGAPRLLETLGVRFGIVEFQRVAGREIFEELAPTAAIDRYREALLDGEAMMVPALGADVEIALDLLAKRNFAA